MRIAAYGDVDTEKALDMVETLTQIKRAELKRRKQVYTKIPTAMKGDQR